MQFRAFTPDTNPSAYNAKGTRSVRIEDIHFDGGLALAQVQTAPLHLEVEGIWLQDRDNNDLLSLGETATFHFWLNNQGGLTAPQVRTVLSADDPAIHIEHPETRFGDTQIGPRARLLPGETSPQVSLDVDPGSNRQVQLTLEVFSGGTRLAQRQIPLKIASAFTWSGRVIDEAGNGVKGVRITFYGSGPNNTFTTNLVTTTADGTYRINLIPGFYSAQIQNDLFGQGYGVALNADLYLEFVLLPLYPLSGTIRDSQGQPVSGATLTMIKTGLGGEGFQEYVTGKNNGTYTMMLAKGTYNISAGNPDRNLPARVLRSIHIDGPQTLDIDLHPGVRLNIQATDEQGGAAEVSAFMGRLPSYDAVYPSFLQTDSRGRGGAPVLPGLYGLSFYLPGSPYSITSLWLPVFADTTVQVVVPKTVALTGTVNDQSSVPFLSSSVFLEPQAPYGTGFGQVTEDGTYTARAPAGRWQVVFEGSEPGRRLRQWLGESSAAGDKILDLTVPSGEQLIGWVKAGDGQSLVGMEVHALSVEAGVSGSTRLGADGTFSFYLQPGTYQLTGADSTFAFSPLGTVEVPFADTLELQTPRGGILRGRVVDVHGYPIEQAMVLLTQDERILTSIANYTPVPWLYQSGSMVAAARSGGEGVFQLRARPGTYDLMVLPGRGTGVGRLLRGVSLSGDHTQEVVLPASEIVYQVYGRIAEEPDMQGGEIVLQFLDDKAGVVAQTTDARRRGYAVELPPGSYQVRAGLLGPVGGFQKVYDVGEVAVDQDRRWDIDLSDAATAVAEETAARPQGFALELNYPNPFNPTTTIRISLPQSGEAELSIYNLLGQRVATLVRGVQEVGPQVLQWNGRDDAGHELASGVYFYRLQAGVQVETRKLLLLR